MTKARSKGCARGCGKKKRGGRWTIKPAVIDVKPAVMKPEPYIMSKDMLKGVQSFIERKKAEKAEKNRIRPLGGGNWFKSQLDPNSVTRTHIVPALGMFGGPMGQLSTVNSIAKFFGKGKKKSKKRSQKKR
jgi:hypothetical protein